MSLLAAAVLASAFAATPLARQQQMPVFRSEANYFEVTARVVDKDGKFIDGLIAKDFEITEDHRRANVEQLFRVDLPTPWNKAATATPAMYLPDLAGDLQGAEGRIYLIYLNSIPVNDVPITRDLAREFVNRYMQLEDVVAVWSTFGAVTFTSDKALLNKKIDEFLGTTDLYSPVPKAGDPGSAQAGLAPALDWMKVVQGRKKSVLLFSAGWGGIAPVFSNQSVPAPFSSKLLDRHDVQIYAVDTRGLTVRATGPAPNPMASSFGAVRPGADAARGTAPASEDLFDGLNSMKWLAEDSGGFAIINASEFVPGFRRIVEENSTYYVLGYQSPSSLKGTWDYHDITVKLTKPIKGARVIARKGFIARPN